MSPEDSKRLLVIRSKLKIGTWGFEMNKIHYFTQVELNFTMITLEP